MSIQADIRSDPSRSDDAMIRDVASTSSGRRGHADLAAAGFPCGPVRRGDAEVGAWLTLETGLSLGSVVVAAAWRGHDGKPRAVTGVEIRRADLDGGVDLSAIAPDAGRPGAGFGFVVGVMDAVEGGHVPGPGTPVARAVGRMRDAMASASPREGPDRQGTTEAVRAGAEGAASPLGTFLATLDPEALALCRDGDLFDTLSHAWDGLDATFVPYGPLAEAVRMAPACASVLALEWRARRDGVLGDGAPASGPALIREVAMEAGVPEGAVRHWGSLAAWKAERPHPGEDAGAAAVWALRALALSSTFPVDRLPRDGDWGGYARAAPVVMAAARVTRLAGFVGVAGRPWLAHVVAPGGRWEAWYEGLAREGGRDPYRATGDLGDMVRALARQVVGPAWVTGTRGVATTEAEAYATAFRALFSGRKLRHALAMSRDWHAARGGMDAAIRDVAGFAAPRGGWPAGLPDLGFEDVRAVVLDTPDALRDEGSGGSDAEGRAGLDHCVADYGLDCRKGVYRVVSLRRVGDDGSWSRLSTVGFRLLDGRPAVDQHVGRRNGSPHPDARFMVHKYLQHLTLSGLATGVSWPDVSDDGEGAGYDPSVPGAWDAVARLWDPHLPRALRGMDAAGWRALGAAMEGAPAWPDAPARRPEIEP